MRKTLSLDLYKSEMIWDKFIGFDKQIMQGNREKNFWDNTYVYRENFDEDWHSRIWISESERTREFDPGSG